MGVHGLWTVLGPVARPVKLESLHGKKLAVDASIWIYHFLKAVRDKEGNALPNAHIVGFFRRICKLLFYGVLPVFVFDGDAPLIKKQTIAGRKQRRKGREEDASRTANKILSLQMQRMAEEEVNGTRALSDPTAGHDVVYFDELALSNAEREKRRKDAPKRFRKLDPYHLPDEGISVRKDDPRVMTEEELEKYAADFSADDLALYDTSNIDFHSQEFAALPITIQYQLLNTARLRSRLRMGYSKEQLDQIFPDRLQFSKFQIARVKERNMLTQKLFNLNGMTEDLSMRVAGERDKEYVLKKNESGWTLALEDNSASKPINIDDEGEEEDDWEEVPINPVSRKAMPSEGRDLQADSHLFRSVSPADNPLFNMSDDELDDFSSEKRPEDLDPDVDMQAAIALSLEKPDNHHNVEIDVVDDGSEIESGNDAFVVSSSGPFLLDTNDSNLNALIASLPKLPSSQTFDTSHDQEVEEKDATFTPSSFNLASSLFSRKRQRDEDLKDTTHTPTARYSPQTLTIDSGSDEEQHAKRAKSGDEISGIAMLSDVSNSSDGETAKTPVQVHTENSVVSPVEEEPSRQLQLQEVIDQHLPPIDDDDEDEHSSVQELDQDNAPPVQPERLQVSGDITPQAVRRESSPEWEEVAYEQPTAARSPAGDHNSDNDDDDDAEEEGVVDFEEAEDTELVDQIAHEVQEHGRFASEINPSSTSMSREFYDEEIRNLKSQQRHDRRDADQVTLVMVQECQELLSRFGIPYITAPMEAEAQCAELLRLGLVDGVVTDDSDIFLFGASRVYKNMFNQAKFVECYLSSDIAKELHIDRQTLIDLAHLLGSDYTPGIPGVGPVTAMQLINDFKSDHTLIDFKQWWNQIQRGDTSADISSPFRKKFKKKSKKLFLSSSFPDPVVNAAYLHPTIDSDTTAFVWGTPDLDRIRGFLMSTIGWSKERADEVLVPLIKSMNVKKQSLAFGKAGFGFRQ